MSSSTVRNGHALQFPTLCSTCESDVKREIRRVDCGVLLEWGLSDRTCMVYVAECVQSDVGLANLVYTRFRALWRSGGAIWRENERERERRAEQKGVLGEEG